MSVTRINEFTASLGNEERLCNLLKSVVSYITGCDGCLSCELLRVQDSASEFVIIEKWLSIDAHKKSLADYPKESMQSAMVLFAAPPSGKYCYGT